MKTAIRFHDIKELHDYPPSEIVTIKEDTLQMVVDPGDVKNGKFGKFCIWPLFTVKATKLQHDFNERNWYKNSVREVRRFCVRLTF